ncbi:MAG: acetate kinase, partial [Firmicutes bacterium]|nr:acetate kinase [Candidatus Gallilactobacillus intestinavium]
LGLTVDHERNDVRGEKRLISGDNSSIQVFVIPTDEERMIAMDVCRLLQKIR